MTAIASKPQTFFAIKGTKMRSIFINNDDFPRKYKCILLEHIHTDCETFRNHCWVKYSKKLDKIASLEKFSFTAIITSYTKNGRLKHGLRHIRHIKALS